MADTPPAALPIPCTIDSIYLVGWQCVADGEETKYVPVYPSLSEVTGGGLSLERAGGCGGKCPKSEAIRTAREMKWSADELVKVLKALQ